MSCSSWLPTITSASYSFKGAVILFTKWTSLRVGEKRERDLDWWFSPRFYLHNGRLMIRSHDLVMVTIFKQTEKMESKRCAYGERVILIRVANVGEEEREKHFSLPFSLPSSRFSHCVNTKWEKMGQEALKCLSVWDVASSSSSLISIHYHFERDEKLTVAWSSIIRIEKIHQSPGCIHRIHKSYPMTICSSLSNEKRAMKKQTEEPKDNIARVRIHVGTLG